SLIAAPMPEKPAPITTTSWSTAVSTVLTADADPGRLWPQALPAASRTRLVRRSVPSSLALSAAASVIAAHVAAWTAAGCGASSRELTRLAALSISCDHLRQPVAAVFHCSRCLSRNSVASKLFGSIDKPSDRLTATLQPRSGLGPATRSQPTLRAALSQTRAMVIVPVDAARLSPRVRWPARQSCLDARGARPALRAHGDGLGAGERRGAPRAPSAWPRTRAAGRRGVRVRVGRDLPASRRPAR